MTGLIVANPGLATAVPYGAGTGPVFVAIEDMNRDGAPDVITANSAGNNVSIVLASGGGVFQSPVRYAAGTNLNTVATGDLNNDGKADLVTANGSSNNIMVLLGNGNGLIA